MPLHQGVPDAQPAQEHRGRQAHQGPADDQDRDAVGPVAPGGGAAGPVGSFVHDSSSVVRQVSVRGCVGSASGVRRTRVQMRVRDASGVRQGSERGPTEVRRGLHACPVRPVGARHGAGFTRLTLLVRGPRGHGPRSCLRDRRTPPAWRAPPTIAPVHEDDRRRGGPDDGLSRRSDGCPEHGRDADHSDVGDVARRGDGRGWRVDIRVRRFPRAGRPDAGRPRRNAAGVPGRLRAHPRPGRRRSRTRQRPAVPVPGESDPVAPHQ